MIDIARAKADIQARVRFLNLPSSDYFLGGSAIMQYLGLRWARDLDVFVKPSSFLWLWDRDGFDIKWPEKDYIHRCDPPFLRVFYFNTEPISDIDIFYDWRKRPRGFGNIDVRKGINEAEIIDGISFMSLRNVYKWKNEVKREKDLPDLIMIEDYWKQNAAT